jgi:hypothetical protein
MAHIPTFPEYLDAITGGLRHAVTAFRNPDVEPDWAFLSADIESMRDTLRRMNVAAVHGRATARGEKIPSLEQLTQAIQHLTSALNTFQKRDREKVAAKLESSLHALAI